MSLRVRIEDVRVGTGEQSMARGSLGPGGDLYLGGGRRMYPTL